VGNRRHRRVPRPPDTGADRGHGRRSCANRGPDEGRVRGRRRAVRARGTPARDPGRTFRPPAGSIRGTVRSSRAQRRDITNLPRAVGGTLRRRGHRAGVNGSDTEVISALYEEYGGRGLRAQGSTACFAVALWDRPFGRLGAWYATGFGKKGRWTYTRCGLVRFASEIKALFGPISRLPAEPTSRAAHHYGACSMWPRARARLSGASPRRGRVTGWVVEARTHA